MGTLVIMCCTFLCHSDWHAWYFSEVGSKGERATRIPDCGDLFQEGGVQEAAFADVLSRGVATQAQFGPLKIVLHGLCQVTR
ncbi:unnamed protein product [Protopolystoma xenopodis]|uniref:Secreted protein n=1 Tax=Protopolystoma xenopodis TaxID=117903 RepID=A0A448WG78_9PLAT|nr:unnamed protein product [Protopolystoma xenopodis]